MPTQAQLDELDAIIADLKAHPKKHRQDAYVRFVGEEPPTPTPALDCGSAFCIAGAAVARAGIGITWFRGYGDGAWYATNTTMRTDHHWIRSICSVATELLGLDWVTADELFAASNTMEDIERIRASLTVTEAAE